MIDGKWFGSPANFYFIKGKDHIDVDVYCVRNSADDCASHRFKKHENP